MNVPITIVVFIFLTINLIYAKTNDKSFISQDIGFETNSQNQKNVKLYSRLMVIGGKNDSGFLSDVEMIDPFNTESRCKKIAEFPQQRYFMVANFINGEPIICGGYSNNTFANLTLEEICFRLDNKTEKWESHHSPSLHYPRAYAAGALIDGSSWWITGGYHWYFPSFTSSDILTPKASTFMPFFELPEQMMNHCMAAINTTHVFLAGGSYGTGQQGIISQWDRLYLLTIFF